ncbi:hypothetical protein H2200_007537 [Cladophialophora chaetospira]|uniref:Uncharacterized protein n=1 Tax=Cladophialophora chaetospira TaxID=386627 RepID=A0AA39CHK1_9EURO|nr:hypothetical protein H2200_007537 [Cladophialophora chaetospira]
MDLKDACDRIKRASRDDWVTHGAGLIDTWKYLTLYLQENAVDTRSDGDTARPDGENISPYLRSQLVLEPIHDNFEPIWASSHSTNPTFADNSSPSPVPSGSSPEDVHPTKTNSNAAPKPNSSIPRHVRVWKNIVYNAQERLKVLEECDIKKVLTRRITEFRPALAGFDVARSNRHSLQRIGFFFEGYLGTMHIAKTYREFQRKKSAQDKGPGKVKIMYKEFAHSVGMVDSGLTPLIQLGEVVLKIHDSGSPALLLLMDRLLGTIRQLSGKDIAKLVHLCGSEPQVKKIIDRLNNNVDKACRGYQEVVEKVWSPKDMVARAAAIHKIMGLDYPADQISSNAARHGSEHCPEEPFSGAETAPAPATPPSERTQLSSPPASPSASVVGQHESQDRNLRSDTHRRMDMLLAAALNPQRSREFESETRSARTGSQTSEDGNEPSCKRRRLDNGSTVVAPRGVEICEAFGPLRHNPSSDCEGRRLMNDVADQHGQWQTKDAEDEPSLEPETTDIHLAVPGAALNGHAGSMGYPPVEVPVGAELSTSYQESGSSNQLSQDIRLEIRDGGHAPSQEDMNYMETMPLNQLGSAGFGPEDSWLELYDTMNFMDTLDSTTELLDMFTST